jgi:Amt family ammonium transporter
MHDNATMFLLICTALVLFMTPGLAFFYGGLVRASSVVSMMMMSFGSLALVSVLWILYGYAISFANSETSGSQLFGIEGWYAIDVSQLGLERLISNASNGSGFDLAFTAFQGTFAVITVALISGAIADRAKFGSWMLFAALWSTAVYFPIAGWVFNFTLEDGVVVDGGWLVHEVGLLDFAGGTVVEVASGASALAAALVLGRRFGFTKGMHAPHNVPLTLIGVGILWFGWFGFNAGSELAADGVASLAWVNTLAAGVGGLVAWLIYEKVVVGKPTAVGGGSGAIAGLVAITPSCGFLNPIWALALGLTVGLLCAIAVEAKWKFGFDDSLDVVGIHMVGGIVGTLWIGLFGHNFALQPVGLMFGAGIEQLGRQAIGVLVIGAYAFSLSYLFAWVIQRTIGFRVSSTDEIAGVDRVLHGEEAYSKADPRWTWGKS